MKITPAPITTFAKEYSLTKAEWAGLHQAVQRIERFVGRQVGSVYLANAPPTVMPSMIAHYARSEIRSILGDSGLSPDEWFIYLAPVLPEGPLPPRIEEWVLHLRLHTEVSSARAAEIQRRQEEMGSYILVPFEPKE